MAGYRYAGVIYDDTAAAPGLSLSIFLQGCPIHCKGCHNYELWEPEGGYELTALKMDEILSKLYNNGVMRNLCIMGGEPMAPYNLATTSMLISLAQIRYPDIKIYLWTGYTYEELLKRAEEESVIEEILNNLTCLIDGPYIEEERDITLKMRGSKNQRIIYLNKEDD
jgi:anaerobic ribonucleoside-triphosphate reductase activating protein